MKRIAIVVLLGLQLAARGANPEAAPLLKLRPIPFTQVQIQDSFWAPKQETNRLASIPVNFAMLEKSGNIRNFELAGAHETNGFTGPVFMDSDLYKAIESASYSLATHPDPKLEERLDQVIAKIAAAQQADGYLDTYYIVKEPGKRWTNLRDNHELYCAGHLFEAAVAHFQATGKRTFLDVAIKLANHIDSVFGTGKRMGYPGHPEIELALVKLSRVTGEKRYFELARFFIENRGKKFFAEEHHEDPAKYDGTYWLDDVPITEHKKIKGHAVRAAYLLSGATDVASETSNPALLRMIDRVWRNTTQRNMYVTGGIGPSASNEGFTTDYDLPNLSAYQETCASVALAQWNYRLALLYGDARYADIFERSLYNGSLAGVSLEGTHFFYVNPLASNGNHHRSGWFGCACCPPNEARTLASLGGYAYAVDDDGIWVNLYIQGTVMTAVQGQNVSLNITTDYPWDGKVVIQPKLEQPTKIKLHLRVPGWCQSNSVAVNRVGGVRPEKERGYYVFERTWRNGDSIELNFAMPVERVVANPRVKDDLNQIALQRGPLVYCLESCDQREPLSELTIPGWTEFRAEKRTNLLGGVVVLRGLAESEPEKSWADELYSRAVFPRRVSILAIPYYAWDNRKPGPMKVWLPTAAETSVPAGVQSSAKVELSFTSDNCQPAGVNDGVEPKSSHDHPSALCHWWPHKGTEEWVQYTWAKPVKLCATQTYWFEDEGVGECRLPESWRVEYLSGSEWKPVQARSGFPVRKDDWCEAKFSPISTTGLRLLVKLPEGWATGVQEWKLTEVEED